MPTPDERGTPSATAETVVFPAAVDETVVLPAITGEPVPDGAGDQAADRAGDESADTGSVARNSAVMAVGSIVSRLTGFLRTAALAAAIGAEAVADDYTLANTLPNMVYELLLGGMLASVVVPVLVRAKRSEPDGGEAYTQRLLTLTTMIFGVATVLAVAAAPLLTQLMLIGNDRITDADRSLTTTLAYLLLPEIFCYGMAAMFAAILNVRGHFAAPMWTPILNNLVVMATAGAFAVLHTDAAGVRAESLTTLQIGVLGVGTTLGIVVQAAGLLPALRRVGFRWRFRWDFGRLGLRELARLGSWMLLYVGVTEIGVLVVIAIAKNAGDRSGPGPAIFNNAFLIFMMAHGIVAVSIMTALLPRMSAAAADGRLAEFADQLSLGTRLSSVILVPASFGYLVLGRPMAIAFFEAGAYSHQNALDTGWVIAVAGLALLPYAITQLQTAAFYALSDTRTPALVSIPMVIVRIITGLALLALVSERWIATGLMASSGLAFVVGTAIGYWLLRRRVGPLGLTRILGTIVRLSVASAVGAAAAVPAGLAVRGLLGDGKAASALELLVGGIVLAVVFFAAARLLRIAEIAEVTNLVTRRMRRA